MNKTEGFDPKKFTVRPTSTFSTRNPPVDPTQPERTSTQFQGYKQPANPNMPRTQELGVSRGIFQSRRENFREDNLSYSARHISDGDRDRSLSYYHKQVLQDFVNNDLKSQIEQFRSEMVQAMEMTVKDFCLRANKDQEIVETIRESITQHSYHIEQLFEKIQEHHLNLDMISSTVQAEIGSIKQNMSGYSRSLNLSGNENSRIFSMHKMQRMENQQQEILKDFERLKEEITESLHLTMEEYEHGTDQEENDKINKILFGIKSNMEQKIEKVLEHLNGKVAVLEKQIQNYSRSDDPVIDKIKFELEDKVNEQTQKLQEQVEYIKRAAETKADEETIKQFVSSIYYRKIKIKLKLGAGLDEKVERAKDELESIKAELAMAIEKVQMEKEALNTKVDDFETKFNREAQQLRVVSQGDWSNDIHSSKSPNRKNRDEYERRIDDVERRFYDISQEQRGLEEYLNVQKMQLQSTRMSNTAPFEEFKTNGNQLEETRLKKLEEIIDRLGENMSLLKNSFETNEPVISIRYPEISPFKGIEASEAQDSGSRKDLRTPNSMKKDEAGFSFTQANDKVQGISTGNEQQAVLSSRDTPVKPSVAVNPTVEAFKRSYHRSSTNPNPDRLGLSPKVSESVHKRLSITRSPGTNSPQKSKFEDSKTNIKAEPEQSVSQENDDDEVDLVLQIDDDGFLLDEKGNHYLDDKGEKIKIEEDLITHLRANNLIEEEVI